MDSGKHRDLQSLQIEEGAYFTRLTKKFQGREVWERPDPREVHSYIPGMVVRIVAQEGDRLAVGAPILTFEAMKMENTLTMPYDGVVRKLHVKVGDVFAKDIILAEIDSA
jgi:biotin carboxyl carrier protein